MNYLVDHVDFLSVCHQQLLEINRIGLSREVNTTSKGAGEGKWISLCPEVTLQSTWSGLCLPGVYQKLLLAEYSNRKQSFAAAQSFLAFTVSYFAIFVCCPRKDLTKGLRCRNAPGMEWGDVKEHSGLGGQEFPFSEPGKIGEGGLNHMLFFCIIKWIHFSWPTC